MPPYTLWGIAGVLFTFILWLFKPHLVDALAQFVGGLWHLVTRRSLDDQSAISLVIHKKAKILRVQQFLRVSQRR